MAIDVMFALQNHYGYLSDEALEEGAALLGMTPWNWKNLPLFTISSIANPWGNTSFTSATGSFAG